jgi:Ca2+-binding EF-hand superfamily protein
VKIQTTTILLISLFSVAFAEERIEGGPKQKKKRPDQGRAADFFKQLDLDSDAKVSREEFAKGKRASQLPAEARIKIFDRLDKNNDGVITAREFKGASGDWPKRYLTRADKDKSGRVSYHEFLATPPSSQADPERLKKMFDRMDRNSDGFLDRKDQGPSGGRKRSPRMEFSKLDLNQDGAVSRAEFRKHPGHQLLPEQERRQRFDRIDGDENGKLSASEVRKHFEKWSERNPRRPTPKK